jgi:hypothetical protein
MLQEILGEHIIMGIMVVLANLIGPAFLVIAIPVMIISYISSPRNRPGINMFIGLLMLMILSPASALYVWYKYNFIAAIIVGIVIFYIGHKLYYK